MVGCRYLSYYMIGIYYEGWAMLTARPGKSHVIHLSDIFKGATAPTGYEGKEVSCLSRKNETNRYEDKWDQLPLGHIIST